ncbi:phosphoglycerate mutase-like protein [Vararia minispora EC-137]|uniref:Phosphoglycerate mutase-like protein n=1 Tax=Vararia minispora EC-137 TaxID=1314806 RepID=A0ACB8QD33_9AGAM|nr:phosphoglycerate mutase-like protein [Vararia minispora EC-137]
MRAVRRVYSLRDLLVSFVAGVVGHLQSHGHHLQYDTFGAPYAGSTQVHDWPPTKPTNRDPALFPSNVGHAGVTPTGAEPALIATAPMYPTQTSAPGLLAPPTLHAGQRPSKDFDLLKKWGNLSPWYSVRQGAFGIDSSPEAPESCRVTGLHFVHRHGARYPTSWASYGGPSLLAGRLHKTATNWTAKGELEFLNDWTYKLGEEVLTPFGRQQLFDLGVSMRLKYGFLLENFTNTLPVYRTESQDRMLYSALNFAAGFFGIPYEDKYLQSITIEDTGFNNTLAPYKTCTNANNATKGDRGTPFVRDWAGTYLRDARDRLQSNFGGIELSIEDVYTMQQMCAYETVAIGFSAFCSLFTEAEWEGFDYAMDVYFWYSSGFGSPVARALGIGWIQELVARLTHTPIETHNSSTNATLDDNPTTFPLSDPLYVDATHEVVVLNIITALNLTSFAEEGPLPTTHIPSKRTYKVSQLAPFGTNMQFQLLSCEGRPEDQIRIVINDAVAPLTGIEGCEADGHGMCPVPTFIAAQKKIVAKTDWNYVCEGKWDVPAGHEWSTTTGDPPGVEW